MSDMYPYGPLEEAMYESGNLEIPKQSTTKGFWLGVVVTAVIGGVIWGVVAYKAKKETAIQSAKPGDSTESES